MRMLITMTLLAAALAAPPAAAAQRISSPYEFIERRQDLGAFVGYLMTSRGTVDLGPKSGLIYGLQYGLRLSQPLQFSAFGAYMPGERDVIDPAAEGGPASVGTEDIDLLLVAARLQLNLTGTRSWHNLVPYILGGIGIAIDLTGEASCFPIASNRPQCAIRADERFDFGSSFLGQAGLGVAWIWTERTGARLSFHDNIWRLNTPDGFFNNPDIQLNPVPSDTEWVNNLQLTLALSYWF